MLGGTLCLLLVVLTHVCEALHLFPMMGWGRPNSPGHYLDLASATVGGTLLLSGLMLQLRSRRGA